jgi:sialic acid synthase SpsE
MKKLVDFAKSSNSILGDGVKIIQQSEYATINSQRKSLYASKDITTGEKITYNNITVKGPGGGILPKYIDIIINRKTKKKILEDHPITWDDI